MAGPLSSVLTNRFGVQLVVMTGGVLISAGTIATSFTSSINQMYITYGVIAGMELLSSYFVSLFNDHRKQFFSNLNKLINSLFPLDRFGLLSDFSADCDHLVPVLHLSTVSGHCCGFHWRVSVYVCFGTR